MHEQAAQSKLLCPIAIGEEAVIADALEPIRQNVKQEPADEFVGAKSHDLLAVVIAIVLPAKLNLPVIDIEQAIVGDGDTVRISRDILEDFIRSGEGWLCVDHPIFSPGGSNVTQENFADPKRFEGGREL